MDSLKMSFTKGIATLNVKTNNFMEESKCKTYISTLEKEITSLKQQIGETVYSQWAAGGDYASGLDVLFDKIKKNYDEIEVQKEKIRSLAVTEQQILGNGTQPEAQQPVAQQPVAQQPVAAAQPEQGVVVCPNCGMQNAANYKFCVKCGVQIKE